MSQHEAEFDLDEDLFDFAGVAHEAPSAEPEEDLEEIFASFREPAPAEPPAPAPATARVPAAAPPAPAAPVRPAPVRPAPLAPAPMHVAPRAAVPEPRGVPELVPAPRARFSKGVVAIALAVTLLNSVLAVVMLRARSGTSVERPAPEHHEDEAHAAPPRPQPAEPLPDPEAHATTHSHPALDEAREEITRGEYAAARRRIYGLLSIIDRLDDPRRAELEADCQFLIAQALHLEALARMGGGE